MRLTATGCTQARVRGIVALVVLLAGLTPAVPAVGVVAASEAATGDAGGVSASRLTNTSEPKIVELYPNPVTPQNRGEYLVVHLPAPGNWSVSDGYYTASLPANRSGTFALSLAPALTQRYLTHRDIAVYRFGSYFRLAASGDRITLRRNGTVVDTVTYGRVREGHRWRATWDEWRPNGYVPRDPQRAADVAVTPFVLPDTPDVPVAPLTTATDRLYVAGYTIESARVTEALLDAAARGVDVRVLIEGSPVGGFPTRGARVADRLVAGGVTVRVLAGDVKRFRYHHAKYAVADDTAVVLTENWKPAGTGGNSSRGWGVRAADPAVADDLAALFVADATAPDAVPWKTFRATVSTYDPPSKQPAIDAHPRGRQPYPTRFEPPPPADADVELLTTPGNAGDRLVARIDAADERILAIVPRTGGPDGQIVRALRRAANRGVRVHLLVSDAWYDREPNHALVSALESEPIDVAIAAPRGRYQKIHAKGLVIDDTAVVGSLNWNDQATTENREVLLAVEHEAIADFYARVYAADWRGGGVHLPVGMVVGLAGALVCAERVTRRTIAFALT